MPAYALTIFIGAFLLFQVQPLIGKYILPWFGGGPGIWTTCMLFFQLVLLAGYAYAHLITRQLKPRAQILVHFAILIAAVALLPIIPSDAWKPQADDNPTLKILALLMVTIGLPYFVLSSTGPLMQQWFSHTDPGRSPYRLYALSNAGSLLALLSFPFYFETHYTRKTQASLWGWGLVVYALASAICGRKLWQVAARSGQEPGSVGAPVGDPQDVGSTAPPTTIQKLLWLLLPASASVLLLATTNKICQDVAVMPFLWILPLALYLLSFIICFDSPRWYHRVPFTLALIAGMVAVCWALFKGTDASLPHQLWSYSAGLFVCCMVCHGELYRLRPAPQHLTSFYLLIAAGGALGGVFVAVLAPLLFTDYFELHWGLLLCVLLFVIALWQDRSGDVVTETSVIDSSPDQETTAAAPVVPSEPKGWQRLKRVWKNEWLWLGWLLPVIAFAGLDWSLRLVRNHYQTIPQGWIIGFRVGMWLLLAFWVLSWVARGQHKRFRYWRFLVCAWLFVGVLTLGLVLRKQAQPSNERVFSSRNFYGVLSVFEHNKASLYDHHLLLMHGRITHGLQFVEPRQATWATTYYGTGSGIDLAVRALGTTGRRIGVVGLGTGTTAALARAGDSLHIYEINPQVRQLATSRFTYLSNCPAALEISMGDARLSLEREPPQQFDLLALDAFSSDAIPVHLLTREAFQLYDRHLKTNGVLAVHISNHYLDLEPVVVNLAHHFHYQLAMIDYDEEEDEADWWLYSSTWMLLSHNRELIESPSIKAAATSVRTNQIPLWTDDFASLFQILKK